ncbi:hypothetical protein ANCCAN_16474 [Ancylostoma caninum]|uniref:Uncharacterized protein n=1 Tax=Ancylostoma caninum TaxID=29170 RepID=A0A368G3R2_ANCCA|nr:hypothetical protein ANCCAN_16474 [Ancylostoma caninum]
MASAAVFEDVHKRITVVSNVAHGVSPNSRGMDVILDRMLNQDDGKGLGSGSDSLPTDILPVEMRFSLLVEKISTPEEDLYSTYHTPAGHLSVQNILYPPLVSMSSGSIPPLCEHCALPCNLQLLTIRSVGNGQRLLTIYNSGTVCRTNTATTCSGDLQKGLIAYLKALRVATVQEANLAGSVSVSSEVPVDNYRPVVHPNKFLSLLLNFSNDN